MKKILCAVLALMLVMGLATTAFAANVNVTIKDASGYTSGRKYNAYQLMTVTVSAQETEYAYTVNSKYETVLESALGLTAAATGEDIIAELAKVSSNSETMHHISDALYRAIIAANLSAEITDWNGASRSMSQGYWLVADVTDLSGTLYANSLVMIDTVGNSDITINNKPRSTTTEKKVDDENDSIIDPNTGNEDAPAWNDVADYDIGDEVPYKITINLANDAAQYEYFSFVIQDSVEKGLTYNPDSFVLSVNGEKVESSLLAEAGSTGAATAKFLYVIETDVDKNSVQTAQRLYVYPNFSYTPTGGTKIEANKTNGGNFLEYFPASTDHSLINSASVTFEYTCTLNDNAVIGIAGNPNKYSLKFSNNPYDYKSYGKTPDETVITLTYQLIVNKIDQNQKPLAGAVFTLYKFYAFELPTGMSEEQAVEAGYFNHPGAKSWGEFRPVGAPVVGAEGTQFSFNGLDDGYYKIVEDTPPDGYNKIEPIEFRIIAKHVTSISGTPILTDLEGVNKFSGTLTFTKNIGAGSLTTAIENRTGKELPSTGGMGTTVFYILGTVMVLGAAVILVTKKRMSTEA